jgi:hypothetical protein
MEKKDVKLLITGAIALFLACFLGIITLVLFAVKLGGKAMEYDWKSAFGQTDGVVQEIGD